MTRFTYRLFLFPLLLVGHAFAAYPRVGDLSSAVHDPIELAPFTNNGTSMKVPDIFLTELLSYLPDFTNMPRLSSAAVELFNRRAPLTSRTKVLYDVDKIINQHAQDFDKFVVRIMYGTAPADDTGIYPKVIPANSSMSWTTLSGLSYVLGFVMPGVLKYNGCSCSEKSDEVYRGRWHSTERGAGFAWDITGGLQLAPKDEIWNDDSVTKPALCTPQLLSRGRVLDRTTQQPYPVTQDVVHAVFDLISDVLRDETAIPILESMQINTEPRNRVAARMVKVAGLPESAIGNMRGYLTVKQYALYQLLHRGDNDCPIPTTECGKFGPNPCDRYPPLKL